MGYRAIQITEISAHYPKERSRVFRHMILLAFEENIDLDSDFIR